MYQRLSVVKLKEELKRRKLKVSGRKAELIERLEKDDKNPSNLKVKTSSSSNTIENQLWKRKVSELKAILRQVNLSTQGRKQELIERLIQNKIIQKTTLENFGFKPTVYKQRKVMPQKAKRQTYLV